MGSRWVLDNYRIDDDNLLMYNSNHFFTHVEHSGS